MAEIINLRAAKKAKDKSLARAQADANATKFGRTKAEKQADLIAKAKAKRTLDGHLREDLT